MVKLVFIAFGLLIIQGILSYFQITNYRKTLKRLNKLGKVSIGTKKNKIGKGRIVILVSNDNSTLVTGEEMYGISIFARFKKIKDLDGISLERLKEKVLIEDKKNLAMLDAINRLQEK